MAAAPHKSDPSIAVLPVTASVGIVLDGLVHLTDSSQFLHSSRGKYCMVKMDKQPGVYKHDHDENLEEFLDNRGALFLAAKMMTKISPTITISIAEDGTYTIQTKTPVKNFEWTFQLGEEVALPTPDGTKSFIFTVDEDGKLIQTPTGENADCGVHIEREFNDDGMIVTMIHVPSGDQAKRYFTRE